MNLRQIEAFRAVMATGGITSAAELMHISQPAISRLISDLERSTQLKLFVRAGRRLRATPEALAFYEDVKASFAGLESLRQSARNIQNFSSGHLRIAAQPSLGISLLPKVFKKFAEDFPDITISLQVRASETVRHLMATQQFDLAFIYGPFSDSDQIVEIFADIECVCVLRADHPLARKKVIEARDLEGERFISLAQDDIARHQIDQIFMNANVRRNMVIETQYAATICNCVMNGLGLSVLSPFSVTEFFELGLTARKFVPSVKIQYALALPTFRPQSAVAENFLKILKVFRDEELARLRGAGLYEG